MDDMLSAIRKELVLRRDYLKGEEVSTIYFGGGTPSLLTGKQIEGFLNDIHRNFNVAPQAEITLEANPDDLSDERLLEFKQAGVNRLSIGIQSFFDEHLRYMNRVHSGKEAYERLQKALEWFDLITIDLIYGIPGLTDEQWKQNIKMALGTGIKHFSSYALTVEPGTALAGMIRKKLSPDVDDVQTSAQFEMLMQAANEFGFEHYEISNFARDNMYSKHNTSYWQGKKYLGVGPSAHSFNQTSRQWNVSNNPVYLRELNKGVVPFDIEQLSIRDRFNEYLLTGLRTIWGIDIEKVEEEFGTDVYGELKEGSKQFIQSGWMEQSDKIYRLTRKGRFFADRIASELFIV